MTDEEKQVLFSILRELKQIRILLEAQTRSMQSLQNASKERTRDALMKLTETLPPQMKQILGPLLNELR
jgi:hypothetical protein